MLETLKIACFINIRKYSNTSLRVCKVSKGNRGVFPITFFSKDERIEREGRRKLIGDAIKYLPF